MPRARRVCNRPGCPNLTDTGQCPACRRTADLARGSSTERGYARTPEHRNRFRAEVLRRDPTCVTQGCAKPATVADHWPIDRRELVARGMDPNDPRHGRGLCASCHGRHTARAQPGGWNTPR